MRKIITCSVSGAKLVKYERLQQFFADHYDLSLTGTQLIGAAIDRHYRNIFGTDDVKGDVQPRQDFIGWARPTGPGSGPRSDVPKVSSDPDDVQVA